MDLSARLQKNVDLKPLTTFGVGGLAAHYVAVSAPADLLAAVEFAGQNKWPYQILAGGSNVVFPDAGYAGLVVHYLLPAGGQVITHQDSTLLVEAGVRLQTLINYAIAAGLAGLEALSGIPGTVGGAIVGNAGAYGQGISDHLTRVETNNGWLERDACQFSYRDSIFKKQSGLIIFRAEFELTAGDQLALQQKSQEIIATREKKYPPGLRCPGSFFKNVLVKNVSPTALEKIDRSKIIEGKIPAGYLLESVGAKGLKQGGVYIADYHGNLLVNDGTATYQDVLKLAADLKAKVQAKFDILLEEEVRYLT